MIILVVLIYAIIGLIEIIPLYKRNQKKELVLYSITFSLAFILSVLLSAGVKIPSPAQPIEKVVNLIFGSY